MPSTTHPKEPIMDTAQADRIEQITGHASPATRTRPAKMTTEAIDAEMAAIQAYRGGIMEHYYKPVSSDVRRAIMRRSTSVYHGRYSALRAERAAR